VCDVCGVSVLGCVVGDWELCGSAMLCSGELEVLELSGECVCTYGGVLRV